MLSVNAATAAIEMAVEREASAASNWSSWTLSAPTLCHARPTPVADSWEAHSVALAGLCPESAGATARLKWPLGGQHLAQQQRGRAIEGASPPRFISFGFKYGLPVDADVVLDVRLLDNPFFVPELRNLPGTDPAVRDYILKSPEAQELLDKAEDLLAFSLPRYEGEGKSYLTVAVGCTGGRHRSVTVSTELADRLREKTKLPILVFHRDVARADIVDAYPPSRGG